MTKASHFFLLCSLLSAPIFGSSTASAATLVAGTFTGGVACLTDSNRNTADGNPILAFQCFEQMSQQWKWEALAIQGIGTSDGVGKCVTAIGTAFGTPVQLFRCNGSRAQEWIYQNGQIKNPVSGGCLDVGDGANGTLARIQFCNFNGGTVQTWAIRG